MASIFPIQPLPAVQMPEPVDENPYVDPGIADIFKMRAAGWEKQQIGKKKRALYAQRLESLKDYDIGLEGLTPLTTQVRQDIEGQIDPIIKEMAEHIDNNTMSERLAVEYENRLKSVFGSDEYSLALLEEAGLKDLLAKQDEYNAQLVQRKLNEFNNPERTEFISNQEISKKNLGSWEISETIKSLEERLSISEEDITIKTADGSEVSSTVNYYQEHEHVLSTIIEDILSSPNRRDILINKGILDGQAFNDYLNNPDDPDIKSAWSTSVTDAAEYIASTGYYPPTAEIDQDYYKRTGQVRMRVHPEYLEKEGKRENIDEENEDDDKDDNILTSYNTGKSVVSYLKNDPKQPVDDLIMGAKEAQTQLKTSLDRDYPEITIGDQKIRVSKQQYELYNAGELRGEHLTNVGGLNEVRSREDAITFYERKEEEYAKQKEQAYVIAKEKTGIDFTEIAKDPTLIKEFTKIAEDIIKYNNTNTVLKSLEKVTPMHPFTSASFKHVLPWMSRIVTSAGSTAKLEDLGTLLFGSGISSGNKGDELYKYSTFLRDTPRETAEQFMSLLEEEGTDVEFNTNAFIAAVVKSDINPELTEKYGEFFKTADKEAEKLRKANSTSVKMPRWFLDSENEFVGYIKEDIEKGNVSAYELYIPDEIYVPQNYEEISKELEGMTEYKVNSAIYSQELQKGLIEVTASNEEGNRFEFFIYDPRINDEITKDVFNLEGTNEEIISHLIQTGELDFPPGVLDENSVNVFYGGDIDGKWYAKYYAQDNIEEVKEIGGHEDLKIVLDEMIAIQRQNEEEVNTKVNDQFALGGAGNFEPILDIFSQIESSGGIDIGSGPGRGEYQITKPFYDEYAVKLYGRNAPEFSNATDSQLEDVAARGIYELNETINGDYFQKSLRSYNERNKETPGRIPIESEKHGSLELDLTNKGHLLFAAYNLGMRGFKSVLEGRRDLSTTNQNELANGIIKLNKTENATKILPAIRNLGNKPQKYSYNNDTFLFDVEKEGIHLKDVISDIEGVNFRNIEYPYINRSIVQNLTNFLIDLQENYRDGKGVNITGAARSHALNKKLVNTPSTEAVNNSGHLYGKDIDISSDSAAELVKAFSLDKPSEATDAQKKALEQFKNKHNIKTLIYHGNPIHIHVSFI